MNRRNLVSRGVLVAFTLMLPVAPVAAQQQPDMSRKAVVDDPVAPKRGAAGYDVSIVELFDYNCPYCRRMEPVLNNLLASDPKVRIVYRDWPIFGAPSIEAARAALASRYQGKHAAFNDALMETSGRLDSQAIQLAAQRAGVDRKRLNADLAAHKADIDAALARTARLAEGMDLTGTPAMVIGSYLLPGAATAEMLVKAVEIARKPA